MSQRDDATSPQQQDAAEAFVQDQVNREKYDFDKVNACGWGYLWHGWALREAFHAGASFARSETATSEGYLGIAHDFEAMRSLLVKWTGDGHLQTFEDRERFRKEAKAILSAPSATRHTDLIEEIRERVEGLERSQVLGANGTHVIDCLRRAGDALEGK